MEVPLAVLADYSNITKEGKLNILGIFNRIRAPGFPYVHRNMELVMTVEASPVEAGRERDIQVKLTGPDGEQIMAVAAKLNFMPGPPGEKLRSVQMLDLSNIVFRKNGDYAFHILIGGDTKTTVPFKVVHLQQQKK